MHDVISIGSALVDTFIYSGQFELRPSDEGMLICQQYGDKLEVDSRFIKTGGGGSNTAVGFTRLGLKSGLISELGSDEFSTVIINNLRSEDVDTSMLIKEKKEQTGGSVIMVGKDGGRSIMVHRGAASMLDPYDIPSFYLSKTKWIHLSSIAGRLDTLLKIFKIASMYDKEIGLSWNPGNTELKLMATQKLRLDNIKCDILAVNKREWKMLENVQAKLQEIIAEIIITDGKKGGEVITKANNYKYSGSNCISIDDTGAGDAFSCAYVTAHNLGNNVENCIRWGVANAESVIEHIGAKPGLLTRDQMEARVAQSKVKVRN